MGSEAKAIFKQIDFVYSFHMNINAIPSSSAEDFQYFDKATFWIGS